MFIAPVQSVCNCKSISPIPIPFLVSSPSSSFLRNLHRNPNRWNLKQNEEKRYQKKRGGPVYGWFLPIDAWAPTIDSESIAPSLFAASLFPYIGFLYFLTKSKSAPKLTLFGFYFLLAFVGATIPAGIYAKVKYGTSLSNVDWLHGGAESLLTLTNLFIVLGLRQALRKAQDAEETASGSSVDVEEEQEKASLRK